jgi:hypothetical protein
VTFHPDELNETAWSRIETIFKEIRIMASETRIVGNSKVMAHLIPNIVAPIDREYTLRYLRGNTNIRNGIEREWLLMKEILSQFFVPVSSDQNFRIVASKWISNQSSFPWDTSIFKVIDNLIIGAQKLKANLDH